MSSLRTLKLRAWIKQRTGIFHESSAWFAQFHAQHVDQHVHPEPRPFAWDSYVCDHVDPDTLLQMQEYEAQTNAPDLYQPIPRLTSVAASSLGYTPEELRAWGLL